MSQRIVTVCKLAQPRKNLPWLRSELISSSKTIVDHNKTPFVLYWAQWHDPWLSPDNYYAYPSRYGIKLQRHAEGFVSFSCDEITKDGIIKANKRKHQFAEQKLYYWHLHQAVNSYSQLAVTSRIYAHFPSTASSLGDEQLTKLLT